MSAFVPNDRTLEAHTRTPVRHNDRLFIRMIVVSLALHAAIVAAYLLFSYFGAPKKPLTQSIIQTKLVKLGQKKPDLLPRLPVAQEPEQNLLRPVTPPTQTPPTPSVATPNNAPAVQKNATPLQKNAAPKNNFSDALKKLEDLERKHHKEDDQGKGDPRGSKAGTVSEFTLQTLGSQYATDVIERIKPHWNVPSVIPEDERQRLSAAIVFFVTPDGKIIKHQFEKKSGNSLYDNALIKAIELSNPLPAPPAELRDQIMRDGIEITFEGSK